MRALFGADRKTAGEIYLYGKRIEIHKPENAIEQRISLIPEDRKGQGVSLTLSIRENISLVKLKGKEICSFMGINRKKERNLADEYIKALNIKAPSMEQLASNLSGGNQQKVAIAKWLAVDADILILDEPTRGIDVGAKYEIYLLMNELIKAGKSIIMISSEMPELIGMSDRILVMQQGRLVGEISGDEVSQEKILEMASCG